MLQRSWLRCASGHAGRGEGGRDRLRVSWSVAASERGDPARTDSRAGRRLSGEMRAAGRTARAPAESPAPALPARLRRCGARLGTIAAGAASTVAGGWGARGGREAWRVAGRRGEARQLARWVSAAGACGLARARTRALRPGGARESVVLARSFFSSHTGLARTSAGAASSSAWFAFLQSDCRADPGPCTRQFGDSVFVSSSCVRLSSGILQTLLSGLNTISPERSNHNSHPALFMGDASVHLHEDSRRWAPWGRGV